ncbi:unnamed protein product, partial [marine sediment metagenome]
MSLISWKNYVDDGTITTTFGTNILSQNNLKTRQIGDIYRQDLDASPLGTGTHIKVDFGSAKETKIVCALNHNQAGAAYSLRFGTTSGATDVGSVAGTFAAATSYDANNDMLYLSTPYTARYFTMVITPVVPGGLVDMGRLWIDNGFVPNIGMDFGMGVIDRSTKTKSRGGSTYSAPRQILRKLDVNAIGRSTADFIGTSADFDSLLTMDLACGVSSEIVVLPMTDSQHNLNRMGVYGTISSNGPIHVQNKG